MASRKIEDLNTPTQERCRAFLSKCKDAGIDVLVYCTLRDKQEQAELYAISRTKPGKRVTNAKPGYSWHNYGSAFDFVPMVAGKPQWKDKERYQKCGEIAESVGLEWAGRWTGSLHETAHCQYRGGLTLKDVQAGKEVV